VGLQVFRTPERSRSASNAGCECGYIESVCEVSPGTGVLRLHVPGISVSVIIDSRCVADGVEVTR